MSVFLLVLLFSSVLIGQEVLHQDPPVVPLEPPRPPIGLNDPEIAEKNQEEALERNRKEFARLAREFTDAWQAWAAAHNKVVSSKIMDFRLRREEAVLWRTAMKKMDRLRKHKIARELSQDRFR